MTLLFVETTRFTERIQEFGAERNLWDLEDLMCQNPELGNIVQGTGGFRKARMSLPGRGKRGACRVIYLHVKSAHRIYFVYLYPKNEEVNLSAVQKRILKQISRTIYEEIKKGS